MNVYTCIHHTQSNKIFKKADMLILNCIVSRETKENTDFFCGQ